MYYRFQSQIDITAFNIGFNIFLKAWPVKFQKDDLSSFIKAKATTQRIVMMVTNQLGSNNFGYQK